jgi:predicted TIM-barrel fold metal-dependent hydrolase
MRRATMPVTSKILGERGRTSSSAIRERLTHPVVDGDGHAIEFGPVYLEYLKQVAGPEIRDRHLKKSAAGGWWGLSPEERLRNRVARPSSWTMPTKNTLDRATAMLPRLFRARMDDFGLDFTIVYSTMALGTTRDPDDELRQATCRALNVMFADLFREHADRMAPVAVIPANTPAEALTELEYAVKTLGFKAVMIASNVRRPIPAVAERAPELAAYASWMDTLCMDGPYDYDPVWAKCVELNVAVTSHSPSVGWGSRVVTNHYIHNHVGSFAASGEAFAKALVLGGVTKRFPALNFAFLEGGVAWASELYAGLVSHCGKRNASVIENIDPHNVDGELLADLFAEFGAGMVDGRPVPTDDLFLHLPNGGHQLADTLIAHELDALGITCAEDLRPLFEPNFYYGCEADDPLVSVALDPRLNPFGARLKPMFSSDVGHWDVPDMTEVLAEAYELVEHGLIDARDFEEFTFRNAVSLHAGMNPDFFKGTVVEEAVAKLVDR